MRLIAARLRARRRAVRSPHRRAAARRPRAPRRTAPPRRPGRSSPCSASSTTATRSARVPQNGALTCQPRGSVSPLPTTRLPRAPPTTTRRPPGTRTAAPAAMVSSEPTKSRTTSAPATGHRLLDRGRRVVGAELRRPARGPRAAGRRPPRVRVVVARRICTARWPRPPTPITSAGALADQRVALRPDRVVGREPGVGQRREHGRRHPVGHDEVALVGQQDVVGQSAVAPQAAADPAVEGDAVVVLAAPAVVALPARPDAVHHAVATDQRVVGVRRRPPRPGRRPRGPGSAAGRRAGCPPRTSSRRGPSGTGRRPGPRPAPPRPCGVGTGTSTSSSARPQPGSRYADISPVTASSAPAGRGHRRTRGSRRCPPGARPT